MAVSSGLTSFSFTSAGVGATAGTPCPKPAILAGGRFGVDLTPHRAKHVQGMPFEPEDLLIAMDRYVFGKLAQDLSGRLDDVRGPGNAALRLMLQDLPSSGEPGPVILDVPDPMGMGLDAYLSCYKLLVDSVTGLLDRLAKER